MNITREVILDLWPLYVAGEASADTRQLVEAFLAANPDVAQELHERPVRPLLEHAVPRLPSDREAQALRRTKRLLHGFDWTLFLAMIFSGSAFGRIIADTSWDVSPRNFIVTAAIAVAFWIAFFTRLFWVRRRVFQPVKRR